MLYCPYCGEKHLVEHKSQIKEVLFKNTKVTCNQLFFHCCKAEKEWAPSYLLDENKALVSEAYKKQCKYEKVKGKLPSCPSCNQQFMIVREEQKEDKIKVDCACSCGKGELTIGSLFVILFSSNNHFSLYDFKEDQWAEWVDNNDEGELL